MPARGSCAALLIVCAQIAAAQPLVYGGDADFPPYEFLDEQGQPAGFNVELIRAVGRELGREVRVELQPWTGVQSRLLRGEFDVASMYRTARRAQEVDFAIPHELVYHEMFTRPDAPPLRALGELAGRRVLVQARSCADDSLTDLHLAAELIRVASEPEALRRLHAGEADVAVVTQAVGRPFDRGRLSVVVNGPPVLLTEYAFVTRPDRRELIEQLNVAVAQLRQSGEYQELFDRWLRADRSAERLRRLGWVLGLATLAVLVVVVWNTSLRRRVAQQTRSLRLEFEERERAQRQLADSEKALRQAQKLETVGRLAGGVAHDFNNLLTIILNYANFLRQSLGTQQRDTEDVDEILAASERAARLTRQLLTFSRPAPLEIRRVDLGALVREVSGLVRRLVGESVRLELVLAPEPVLVDADLTQLEQVILNLAANARDAMPSGGELVIRVEPRVPAAGDPPGDWAALSVRDTGTGMTPEVAARIFEPFFTTKAVGKGTGLGLATVYAVVEKLHGKVLVESAPGKGSTFLLLLPRAVGAATPEVVDTAQTPRGRGERVLVVEDDEALRRAARVALESAGYAVTEARDGEDALALARRTPPDVVVTDVVMPRLGGPQLVATLREEHPRVFVLFVSGYVSDENPLDLTAPRTAFLPKPFTPKDLARAVAELIRGLGR